MLRRTRWYTLKAPSVIKQITSARSVTGCGSSGCSPVPGSWPAVKWIDAEDVRGVPPLYVKVTTLMMSAGGVAEVLTRVTIVSVTIWPWLTVPTVNVTVLPLMLTVPCDSVVEMTCNKVGIGSVTTTLSAGALPLLVTVRVNVAISPGRSNCTSTVLAISGSAVEMAGVGVLP